MFSFVYDCITIIDCLAVVLDRMFSNFETRKN